ncbi:probable G-protein coupled receptor 101 [Ursus americanus]|uniref:G protein-coupled receptor 101 n=2 Tax=Ursus TaxID=9639 RepID=A0A452RD74_URSAM|nr:probable G-protein coupled receptor 101 [Ursus arctos]XP_040497455.1 probable G-protein coupled receptor 101 [Ursus maritimus]XP_040497540.1 probable G-protein coupled receptor 101 [Ursus maritimus]XP_045646376.1 probable G-protein coupled receptor 101 [Ursus americanus]
MTSTCTNSTRENNSSHTCVPLSKMPISLAHGIIRSTVLLIFLTVSFVGNIVLALVLHRKPHLLQVTNRFIFNLLVTDLLQISLVAPWVVATSMPLFWPLNSHFCTALVSLTHLFAFASVNTIVVVSVDRYLSIIHPLSYPSKMTHRRGYMLLYGTWIVAILQSTPPLYGWGQAGFDQRNALCSMIWGASPSYAILSVVSFMVIPLVVMIACYSVVFGAARRQHALLYNVKSHSLGVRAKDRVETEDEEGGRKDAFHGQHGGEVQAQEGGMEAKEGSVESSAGGAAAKGSEEVRESSWVAGEGSVEGKEDGTEADRRLTADLCRMEEGQCNIDLGEDDIELGEDDINFSEDDIEAVNIPESLPASRRNSTGDLPLPRCYECKAAKVIFLIIFSYVLSLGPYCFLAVLAVWVDVQTEVPQWAITIIIWLFFLQCCIHPYVYGYMHKTIKKEIQDMLRKFFCKEKPPKEDSRPDLPGTEGGTEGKTVPSRDSAFLP